MNKKIFGITAPILAIASLACIAIANKENKNIGLFADGLTNDYIITFNGSNVSTDSYDSANWVQPFSLQKTNTIQDKYDIKSVDFVLADWSGTYYYGDNIATFGTDGNIIEFVSQGYEYVYVSFSMVNYANVDLSKSVISYTVDGNYQNETFEFKGAVDEKFDNYEAYFDCMSHYEKPIKVTEVKLVFSCPK